MRWLAVLIAISMAAAAQAGCNDDGGTVTNARQGPETGAAGQAAEPGTGLSEGAPGDVNCVGGLDAVDAFLILQYVRGLRSGSDQCPPPAGSIYLPAADVDGDGNVDAVDSESLVQCIVHIPPGNTLPFCGARP